MIFTQVSKKKYIYTIDDDCFVAKSPDGSSINALEQHIRNLLTPSTPFFFNTLYDPYAEGADFVRGYPFSLRNGAPTAVSHGTVTSSFSVQRLSCKISVKIFAHVLSFHIFPFIFK